MIDFNNEEIRRDLVRIHRTRYKSSELLESYQRLSEALEFNNEVKIDSTYTELLLMDLVNELEFRKLVY